MTMDQIKEEAAKLLPEEQFALAEWIESGEVLRSLRRDQLIRELELGIEQADRGELMDSEAVFSKLQSLLPQQS